MVINQEKLLFHQDNAPCHKVIAKLHELHFKFIPVTTNLFADLKERERGREEKKKSSRERDLSPMKK